MNKPFRIVVELRVWDNSYKQYGLVSVELPVGNHHNLGLMRDAIGQVAEAIVNPLRNQVEDAIEAEQVAERQANERKEAEVTA